MRSNILSPKMALDDFFLKRLDSIKRTFEALTERLADPDVANDRKQMLVLSRERAAVEKTMDAYDEWKVSYVSHTSLFPKPMCSVKENFSTDSHSQYHIIYSYHYTAF